MGLSRPLRSSWADRFWEIRLARLKSRRARLWHALFIERRRRASRRKLSRLTRARTLLFAYQG